MIHFMLRAENVSKMHLHAVFKHAREAAQNKLKKESTTVSLNKIMRIEIIANSVNFNSIVSI